MDRLQLQKTEFDRLAELQQTFNQLPPIVDDSYPEYRHYYERALQAFVQALWANGRIEKAPLAIAGLTQISFACLRAANTVRQAEWDPSDKITLSYRGNELGGECGEAQNEIKKLERERLGIRGSRTTKQKLAEELADVIICTDLIAMREGIDLAQAVRDKFNATSEKVGLNTRL